MWRTNGWALTRNANGRRPAGYIIRLLHRAIIGTMFVHYPEGTIIPACSLVRSSLHPTRQYFVTFMQEPFDAAKLQNVHAHHPLCAIRGVPFKADGHALTAAMLFTVSRALNVNLPIHAYAILPFILYHRVIIEKTGERTGDRYLHPEHADGPVSGVPELIWEVIFLGKESAISSCLESPSYHLARDNILNELRKKSAVGTTTSTQPYQAVIHGFACEVLDTFQDCARFPRRHTDSHVKMVTVLHHIPPGSLVLHILQIMANDEDNHILLDEVEQAVIVPAVAISKVPLPTRLVFLGAAGKLPFNITSLESYLGHRDSRLTHPLLPGLASFHKLQLMYEQHFTPMDPNPPAPRPLEPLVTHASIYRDTTSYTRQAPPSAPSLSIARPPGRGRGGRGPIPIQVLNSPLYSDIVTRRSTTMTRQDAPQTQALALKDVVDSD